MLHRLGRDEEARAIFLPIIAMLREKPPGTDLARVLDRYSELLKDTGDVAGAEAALTEAVAIYTATFGEGHEITAKVRGKLTQLRDGPMK